MWSSEKRLPVINKEGNRVGRDPLTYISKKDVVHQRFIPLQLAPQTVDKSNYVIQEREQPLHEHMTWPGTHTDTEPLEVMGRFAKKMLVNGFQNYYNKNPESLTQLMRLPAFRQLAASGAPAGVASLAGGEGKVGVNQETWAKWVGMIIPDPEKVFKGVETSYSKLHLAFLALASRMLSVGLRTWYEKNPAKYHELKQCRSFRTLVQSSRPRLRQVVESRILKKGGGGGGRGAEGCGEEEDEESWEGGLEEVGEDKWVEWVESSIPDAAELYKGGLTSYVALHTRLLKMHGPSPLTSPSPPTATPPLELMLSSGLSDFYLLNPDLLSELQACKGWRHAWGEEPNKVTLDKWVEFVAVVFPEPAVAFKDDQIQFMDVHRLFLQLPEPAERTTVSAIYHDPLVSEPSLIELNEDIVPTDVSPTRPTRKVQFASQESRKSPRSRLTPRGGPKPGKPSDLFHHPSDSLERQPSGNITGVLTRVSTFSQNVFLSPRDPSTSLQYDSEEDLPPSPPHSRRLHSPKKSPRRLNPSFDQKSPADYKLPSKPTGQKMSASGSKSSPSESSKANPKRAVPNHQSVKAGKLSPPKIHQTPKTNSSTKSSKASSEQIMTILSSPRSFPTPNVIPEVSPAHPWEVKVTSATEEDRFEDNGRNFVTPGPLSEEDSKYRFEDMNESPSTWTLSSNEVSPLQEESNKGGGGVMPRRGKMRSVHGFASGAEKSSLRSNVWSSVAVAASAAHAVRGENKSKRSSAPEARFSDFLKRHPEMKVAHCFSGEEVRKNAKSKFKCLPDYQKERMEAEQKRKQAELEEYERQQKKEEMSRLKEQHTEEVIGHWIRRICLDYRIFYKTFKAEQRGLGSFSLMRDLTMVMTVALFSGRGNHLEWPCLDSRFLLYEDGTAQDPEGFKQALYENWDCLSDQIQDPKWERRLLNANTAQLQEILRIAHEVISKVLEVDFLTEVVKPLLNFSPNKSRLWTKAKTAVDKQIEPKKSRWESDKSEKLSNEKSNTWETAASKARRHSLNPKPVPDFMSFTRNAAGRPNS